MSDQGPQKSDPDRWARHSKTLALWVFVVLMSIFAINFVRRQEQSQTEFTYTEFRNQLESGNVYRVTIFEGRRIEGELRSPVNRDGQDLVRFRTVLPGLIAP